MQNKIGDGRQRQPRTSLGSHVRAAAGRSEPSKTILKAVAPGIRVSFPETRRARKAAGLLPLHGPCDGPIPEFDLMIPTNSRHDGIALRAYFIWNDEGRPHGRHETHWFAAEAAEIQAAPPIEATVPAEAPAVRKAPAPRKPAAAKAAAAKAVAAKTPASAKAAAPRAPAETVVAAAALAAPRAASTTAKGARRAN